MGPSPLRLALALVFGGMVTGGLYWTQQATGRPLPVASPASRPLATPAPSAVATPDPQPSATPVPRPSAMPVIKRAQAALPLPAPPKRIVFRHSGPGEVILTLQGEELVVNFVPATPKAPPRPAKVSAHPPLPTTPVATP